ncbi:uncharacterized protein LOC127794832 [Diospyros lotus]|uniref:uncharacterized protein LOC127794832 n=1 Tax=Diospyros lotus TaxID=55363 RepID=UPI002251B8EA|nr:uncharacterized protein LOC127794832 [Diospyros lotus]
MEQGNIPVLAKKMRQVVKVILLMVRKRISKWKLMVDLNMMVKGRKIAGKSILHKLMFHHHHSPTHPPDGRLSFNGGCPDEYEFSCSSSPAKRPRNHNSQFFFPCAHAPPTHDELVLPADANAVRRELEILASKGLASPAISAFLQSPAVSELFYSQPSSPAPPGFRRTPLVRVTDSPFPLHDVDEGDHRVDEAATEFIMKFYNELRKQNSTRALRG